MKTTILLIPTLVLLLSSACSKQEPAPPAPASETKAASDQIAADVKKSTEPVPAPPMPAATTAVQNATSNATAAVDKAATDVQADTAGLTSKAQAGIDNVRKLIADKNWTEALKQLNELANLKLTPEQQTQVDALKREVQRLMQTGAAAKAGDEANKAIGNLLNK